MPGGVLWAFADAVAGEAGLEHFVTGHHRDLTITKKDDWCSCGAPEDEQNGNYRRGARSSETIELI
jgi:hypothetical protein